MVEGLALGGRPDVIEKVAAHVQQYQCLAPYAFLKGVLCNALLDAWAALMEAYQRHLRSLSSALTVDVPVKQLMNRVEGRV